MRDDAGAVHRIGGFLFYFFPSADRKTTIRRVADLYIKGSLWGERTRKRAKETAAATQQNGNSGGGGGIITRGPPPPLPVNQCVCATRIAVESPLRTLIADSPPPPPPPPLRE